MRRSSFAGAGLTQLSGRRDSRLFGRRSGSIWENDDGETLRRKSVMMDHSLSGFKTMMENAETFMEDEIEQLPIRIQE